ncbi:melanoma-associated antigen B4-like [Sorex fumeus]|uniref:melanoma-associated antigen B4-like n=1 Tax=Sorex fumeus TaxID=62283 RepID=UPI0024AD7185|nr:melanoma-associated antigen B4-like [Sorex fumeus]
MPRGQKSKRRAREKRQQAQGESQSLQDAAATAAEETGSPTPASPDSSCTPLSPSASSTGQGLQKATPTTSGASGVSRKKSDVGANGQDECKPSTSTAGASDVKPDLDPVSRRVGLLVELMLYKYKMKEPVTKAEMLKLVNKRFWDRFSEIFKMATDRLELIFGIQLKKIKPSGHSYTFIHNVGVASDGNSDGDLGSPNKGLLMPLLGVIYLNGNRASEEQIWKFLSILGVYDGEKHFIFGDPRKVITQDFVKEKYLVYRQIAYSDPPRYEFLWGPRAQSETNKAKVLEFLDKINTVVPTDNTPHSLEKSVRSEATGYPTRVEVGDTTAASTNPQPKATSSHDSHP